MWSMLRDGIDPLQTPDVLGTKARNLLFESVCQFSLLSTTVKEVIESQCGTKKFLQQLDDGNMIESVLIPNYKFDRTTLCVSTQVGCDRGCRFCATGKMGLVRNLRPDEIVSQVVHGRRLALDTEGMPQLTNVVYMGMGGESSVRVL